MRKKIVHITDDFDKKKKRLESAGWIMEGLPKSVHHIQYAIFIKKYPSSTNDVVLRQ